jgi:hypothetical protein
VGDVPLARVARVSKRGLWIAGAVQALAFSVVGCAALDLYAHKRVQDVAGLNIHGYRGPVANQKQPREIRLAVVGGTRAFGLGSSASWTVATVVRQQVMLATDRPGREIRQVVPITLAWPGALADSYAATLEYFAYLNPDYICIYDDLGVGGAPLRDEQSGLFARAGYWPVLPVALQEKGMAWRFGSVRAGYDRQSVPAASPGPIRRAAGAGLQLAGGLLSSADRLMARTPEVHRADNPERYATQLMQAVDLALTRARGVVVAVSPAESPLQVSNAAAVLPRLEARAATATTLRLVDLARESLLLDKSQRFDEWNYGGAAIEAAAKRIAPAVIDLIAAADAARSR